MAEIIKKTSVTSTGLGEDEARGSGEGLDNIMRLKLDSKWEYVGPLLTEEMIQITRQSYNKRAKIYSESYEWGTEMRGVTNHDYLHPFVNQLKTGDQVFVIGPGTGRDVLDLQLRGFNVCGVDISEEMTQVANDRGVRAAIWCQDVREVCLPSGSKDAVLIESAIQHIPKDDIPELFTKIVGWLRIDGILLARFRIGKGEVFKVIDEVGERYFTSWRQEEINDLYAGYPQLSIVYEMPFTPHRQPDRPGFLPVMTKKVFGDFADK